MARLSIKKPKSHDCKECKSKRKGNKVNPLDCIWCEVCSPVQLQREFFVWESGNKEVDEFIKYQQIKSKKPCDLIEWIPYDRLSNIKYKAQGGFSKIYSAIWLDGLIQGWNFEQKKWKRLGETKVALKVLEDSQNISLEFLEELHLNLQSRSTYVVKCFGITQEPKSKNYAIILEYAEFGNLRDYLKMKPVDWYQKIEILKQLGHHLCWLHEREIVHKDLHIGNILYETNHRIDDFLAVSDLGLCQPVNKKKAYSEIYGVLPYMAPEVLKESSYSKASDIYAFGGVIYEIVTGYPPFHDRPHDCQTALDICNGVHPTIPEHVPKSIADLLLRCWEPNPKNRITAIEIFSMIRCCFIYEDECKLSHRLTKEIEESKPVQQVNSANQPKIHPKAIYTSRSLSFPKLKETTVQN